MRDYRIKIGKDYAAYDLFLADGDSIVIGRETPVGPRTILADRIGANKTYSDSEQIWQHNDHEFYANLSEAHWPEYQDYLVRVRRNIEGAAAEMAASYPEHPGLSQFLRTHATQKFWYGTVYYLSLHYWDTADAEMVKEIKSLAMLDSIPWSDPQFIQNNELWVVASLWLNVALEQWSHAGLDTANVNWNQKVFDLAMSLPSPARDLAMLSAVEQLAHSVSPAKAVPLAEAAFQTYRSQAINRDYVREFEHRLSAIRAKLPGKLAPAFSLPDSSGRLHTLEDFRGKIVYLDFWGSWCSPCLKELLPLQKLEEQFLKDSSVAFVSIALESTDQIDDWKNTIRYQDLKGVQLCAEGQSSNPAPQAYNIQAVPTFMLINRDGTFINAAAPRPSSGKAEAAIRAAIAKNAGSSAAAPAVRSRLAFRSTARRREQCRRRSTIPKSSRAV